MGASASGRGQSVKGAGRLYCPETGEEAALDCRDLQSPGGGLWEVDWGALNPPSKDSLAARRPGLWRFRELVDPELPEDEIVTLDIFDGEQRRVPSSPEGAFFTSPKVDVDGPFDP